MKETGEEMWEANENRDIEPMFIRICDILSEGKTAISGEVLNIGSREPLL
jgi:hypothetical protein